MLLIGLLVIKDTIRLVTE